MSSSFTLNGKVIALNLHRLQAIMGQAVGAIYIKIDNNICECHANIAGRRGIVTLPAVNKKQIQFLINKASLEAICRQRNNIEFILNEGFLAFKSGQFKGHLPILPIPQEISELNLLKFESKPANFNIKLQNNLLNAIGKCQLQSVYNNDNLTLFIIVKSDKLYVGVSDQFHAALVTLDITEKQAEKLPASIALPLDYAQLLATHFKSNLVAIHVEEQKRIMFSDESTLLELPALQTQLPVLDNLLLIKSEHSYYISADDLNQILKSNTADNADLFFSFKKDQPELNITYKSNQYLIKETLALDKAAKNNKKLKVDIKNILDVCKKLKGKIELSYNDAMIKLTQDNVCYYSQLLQDKFDET